MLKSGLLLALICAGALFGMGCGSSDGELTEAEAQRVVESFFRDLFNVVAGHESLETVLHYYPPECIGEISEREILEANDTLALMRVSNPALREIEIDDFFLESPRFEPRSQGLLVLVSGARIKADGVEQDADAYFLEKGVYGAQEAESGGAFVSEGEVLVIKKSGKAYVDLGDCVADLFKRF